MATIKAGWIGVDLDGTLAHYEGWKGAQHIGAPITPMVERVKKWLAAGKTVKIFTARMHGHGKPIIGGGIEDARTPIEDWCRQHIGQVLDVTNVKDFGMIELWDDRAIQVQPNTGIPLAPVTFASTEPDKDERRPKICAGCYWWTPQRAEGSNGLVGWCDLFTKRTEATHGTKCTAWAVRELSAVARSCRQSTARTSTRTSSSWKSRAATKP